jgi:choline dehydrogenase-like flavoprotein
LIIDLEKREHFDDAQFGVCIAGAGAAGITLAASLAKRGIRTLLLEAGGRSYSSRDQDIYKGEVAEGLAHTGLFDGRFRVLGGSTTQWAGQILELDDFILDKRPWVPGSGWPFSKSELAPYYKRAAEIEGLADAPKGADEIWRQLGMTPPGFGPDLVSAFSDFCLKTNFADVFRQSIETDPNLTVCLHANACEFVLAEDGTTVSGVLCKTLDGFERTFSARTFVLCVGGIEASRFLLQPRRDGAVAPWNRHNMVGRHFQDHLLCHVADIVEPNTKLPDVYLDFAAVGGYRFQHKIKLPVETQQRLGTLDIGGFITYFTGGFDDMARAYATVRLIRTRRYKDLTPTAMVHLAANFHKLLWHKIPYSRSIRSIGPSRRRTLTLNVNCEQSPLSEGRISLSPERDALGIFRAKVEWRSSDQEFHTVRKYVEVVRDIFERNGLGRVVPVPSLYSGDKELASTFRDSFHHIGGTRMSTSEDQGVVAPDLRLFGTKNAYVCSTSVFPSAGFANPTHTLLALTLRLSDHLERAIGGAAS